MHTSVLLFTFSSGCCPAADQALHPLGPAGCQPPALSRGVPRVSRPADDDHPQGPALPPQHRQPQGGGEPRPRHPGHCSHKQRGGGLIRNQQGINEVGIYQFCYFLLVLVTFM